ncbi:MAG: hypothetical protein ABIK65_08060 [Candidatus Eisenbacteria bacterium]
MGLVGDIVMYGRFARGLGKFLRERLTLEEAREIVRRRLRERETNFLLLLERGVFGYPKSPYLPLLKEAGCGFEDIRKMVGRDGLESTLISLRDAGVRVTFEQFKGREPMNVGGTSRLVDPRSFDNPFTRECYHGETGGSTGAGTRILHDLDYLRARAPQNMISQHTHGVLDFPRAVWRGTLPDAVGVNHMLVSARMGRVPVKWFCPTSKKDRKRSLKFRLANRYVVEVARLHGVRIPRPETVRLDEAEVIARWARETARRSGGAFLSTSASLALRIAVAALDEGIDLTGLFVSGGGEPPTDAKVNTIRKSGARTVPSYYFAEVGPVGHGCANPIGYNDHHFMRDHLALIQGPRTVPGMDITVEAFTFTTLLSTAPKLLLNVEIDDYGVLETRSCGCPWEKLGFDLHVRDIRSYRKLTGEGMTLVGSDMERILGERLPARFGGSALDYQLMEEEDERGFTKMSIIVSPRIVIEDESDVVREVLEGLRRGTHCAEGARSIWSQAESLRVKRMEPIWTARGKLLPLHLVKRIPEAEKSGAAGGRKS